MRPITPLITVDAIIEMENGKIILIERKNPPPGWALPGGFVDPGESLAQAARREAEEETSLKVEIIELFHIYSKPWRDPRGDTVSAVYYCKASGEPQGGDDAARAEAFSPDEFPKNMAFDHGKILEHFLNWKTSGTKPSVEE